MKEDINAQEPHAHTRLPMWISSRKKQTRTQAVTNLTDRRRAYNNYNINKKDLLEIANRGFPKIETTINHKGVTMLIRV